MRLLPIVPIVVVGCGPRLETLTSQHHYREAVCAAADGSSGDRAYVGGALIRDLDPSVHVEVIERAHLAHALDQRGDPDEISRRARFVRVRLESNVIPVDDVDAGIAFTAGGRTVGAPVTWPILAMITGERLPPQVPYSTYAHRGTYAKLLLAFVTGGVSLLYVPFRRRSYLEDAPRSEYLKVAPAASALRDAMQPDRCTSLPGRDGLGMSCTWYAAIDPSVEGPLELELAVAYAARRVTHDPACRLQRSYTIPLGDARELATRMPRTFGPRMRPLRELTLAR